MNRERAFFLFLYGAVACMWAVFFSTGADAVAQYFGPSHEPAGGVKRVHNLTEKIDRALAVAQPEPFYRAGNAAGSPFGTGEPEKTRSARSPVSGCDYLLKGVLEKKDPLAILQGCNGETIICTVGDTVCGMKISRIGLDYIELRGRGGRLKLSMPGPFVPQDAAAGGRAR